MVYQEKLVAAIQVDGKTLRESHQGSGSSEVFLPFGSEYRLFFKNIANRKVQVGVNVDGREAIKALLIDANSTATLERFFGDSMNDGNKFKFIEMINEIREHRGDQPEDGLIEIRYKFEKEVIRHEVLHEWEEYYRTYPRRRPGRREDGPLPWKDYWTVSSDDSRGITKSLGGGGTSSSMSMSYDAPVAAAAPANDLGITVEGSFSNQRFNYGHIGELETKEHVIVFQLKGETSQVVVEVPMTTRTKIQCSYCSTRNVSSNNFCRKCGAAVK